METEHPVEGPNSELEPAEDFYSDRTDAIRSGVDDAETMPCTEYPLREMIDHRKKILRGYINDKNLDGMKGLARHFGVSDTALHAMVRGGRTRYSNGAVNRMCSSIREFGFKIPVLARSNGEVVDGHLRLKAARKLGITEVPVILCDEWTPAQVKAFRLMVNRSVNWAGWVKSFFRLNCLI